MQRMAAEHGALDRVILGSDTPSGTGVMPVGIIKTIAESRPRCPAASSIGGVPATDVIAYATSNAARVLRREGGRAGRSTSCRPGAGAAAGGGPADHPIKALNRGDITGIAGVISNGEIRALRSRNSLAPIREVEVQSHRCSHR